MSNVAASEVFYPGLICNSVALL
uniref:Uncharacterized protein n=1 Tax=Arundo donax TaxID=35708 RepID=A0A0A9BGL5_ARUDO